mmetsp:Transcript_49088/g.116849  ORF Transcript_49088/g.116849 Transcript_49088/m.116849 type:complete len:332 (-) Transcript_49088:88-1083(-)
MLQAHAFQSGLQHLALQSEMVPGCIPLLDKSLETSGGPRTGLFKERAAMILGLNPKVLRAPMVWNVFLWKQKQHWAVVLQPKDAECEVRLNDDVLHCNTSVEDLQTTVPASSLYLVYELLLDSTDPYLMLGAKLDFCPMKKLALFAGCIGPAFFEELNDRALRVFQCYKGYNIVGCNCQHFAADYIYMLGVPDTIATDDAKYVDVATQGAAVVSAAGASLGLAAVTGAAGASFGTTALVPLLAGVAAGAGSAGLVGGLCCLAIGAGYNKLYNSMRHVPSEHQEESGSRAVNSERTSEAPLAPAETSQQSECGDDGGAAANPVQGERQDASQ